MNVRDVLGAAGLAAAVSIAPVLLAALVYSHHVGFKELRSASQPKASASSPAQLATRQ